MIQVSFWGDVDVGCRLVLDGAACQCLQDESEDQEKPPRIKIKFLRVQAKIKINSP